MTLTPVKLPASDPAVDGRERAPHQREQPHRVGRLRAVEVPSAVSLVSFDEQPYSGVLAVPMTTVRQDAAELGRLAVEMLCRRIASPAAEPPASVVVPTSLVPRSSVATLRHR